jgi:two-component system sensor histidine kinase MtrB
MPEGQGPAVGGSGYEGGSAERSRPLPPARQPFTGAQAPNGRTTTPGGRTTTPGGQAATASGPGASPSGRAVPPGAQAVAPGARSVTPGGRVVAPGGADLLAAGLLAAGREFLRELAPVARAAWRWGRKPLQPAARVWRRNIQLRVVATTLLMSLGVVSLLGVVVIGQVRNGLLEAKTKAAQGQALGGFSVAQLQAEDDAGTQSSTDPSGAAGSPGGTAAHGQVDPGTWLTDLVQQLASGGQGVYYVVALSSGKDQQPYQAEGSGGTRGPRASGDVQPEESVPADLRSVVQNGGVYERETRIIRAGDHNGQPGLVIGRKLNDETGKAYELYYLFPFTQEEKTLSLVETTLATAGVFVVALLCAIAWLVVRQVVTPVRMAAAISQRLADGVLQERMKVSGDDDIARLGESFNKMAHTLQTKIQQLEQLSRMQRRFVSDVSHELRTPLTTVRMAADVIHDSRDDFDPVTARSAELLQSQLERFESLLSDLLEISRFDAGAAALDAEPIDLRDVVRRVVEAAEPLADRKGSRILVRGDDQPVVAEADARRVERVLRNLVVNAVEHGEGRDVIVRLATAPGAVAVAVRDYGVGLKPGEATRVFNRFWRADPARARTTGGTGLGLSIAVEDARLHGGRLQAWGEPGGGSQFRLTLPVTANDTLHGSPIPLEPEDSRRRAAARPRETAAVAGAVGGAGAGAGSSGVTGVRGGTGAGTDAGDVPGRGGAVPAGAGGAGGASGARSAAGGVGNAERSAGAGGTTTAAGGGGVARVRCTGSGAPGVRVTGAGAGPVGGRSVGAGGVLPAARSPIPGRPAVPPHPPAADPTALPGNGARVIGARRPDVRPRDARPAPDAVPPAAEQAVEPAHATDGTAGTTPEHGARRPTAPEPTGDRHPDNDRPPKTGPSADDGNDAGGAADHDQEGQGQEGRGQGREGRAAGERHKP